MSDNPFDRVIINSREKPSSEDVNVVQSQLDRSLRYLAKNLFSDTDGVIRSGFLRGGFRAVEAGTPNMTVIMKAGLGFQEDAADVPGDIGSILGLDDFSSYKPLPLLADLTVTIPTAPAGPNSRIDIIEVRADRLVGNNIARDIFNLTTEEFDSTLVDKTMEFLLESSKLGSVASPSASTDAVSLKTGVAGNPGVAPSATSGYVAVAEIFVDSAVTAINDADITDTRPRLDVREEEVMIPASAGAGDNSIGARSAVFDIDEGSWNSVTTDDFFIEIPLIGIPVGAKILEVDVYVEDVSATPLNCTLYESVQPGGTPAAVSAVVQSSAANAKQTISLTSIDFNASTNIIEAGSTYTAHVSDVSVKPTGNKVFGIRVKFLPV